MKLFSRIAGLLALGLTLVPAIAFAATNTGQETLQGDAAMKGLMLVGCVLWFFAAPTCMSGGDQ